MDSVFSVLSSVLDHRKGQGKEYSIGSLLSLVLLGFICGCNSLAEVARFAKRLSREQRKELGFHPHKSPAHNTIWFVFQELDVYSLEQSLSKIVASGRKDDQPLHFMVDGKNLRGSKTDKLPKGAQMLACFCSELQGVIAQEQSKGGYDEVTTAIKILRETPLKDVVVTGDAMFADKHFCETVVRQGGNYILPVKGNQPALKQAIEKSVEIKKIPALSTKKKNRDMVAKT